MKKKYVEEVAPALMTKFQYESVMQIPKIEKIVVSVGCGDCKDNAKRSTPSSRTSLRSPASMRLRPSPRRASQTSSCVRVCTSA